MTADIKLLPLPETLVRSGFKSSAEAFARAVAEHNVAARDAEIEALRAEVETLRDGLDYLRQMQGAPDVLELRAKAARAKRLAEALRWYAEQAALCRKLGADGDRGRQALDADGGKRAYAALRDHDREVGK